MARQRANLDLRISHYLEDIYSPGRVGAIVCFGLDRLIEVQPGLMDINTRINEWNFGDPTDLASEGIYITVECDGDNFYFQCFRPDLRRLS